MARQLTHWIDSFMEYTENIPSPAIFRKWAAISTIAGALERKVWVQTYGTQVLYPNMFVVFVAPAGVGKTFATQQVRSLWEMLVEEDGHHLASASVTKASLMDELAAADRKHVNLSAQPPVVLFNSLKICANELGVLIPGYDNEFMNTLTDLWDGHSYSERRRTSKTHILLEAPQLNLLAATTPSYMNDLMPAGAWEQGFISRVMLIYSGESQLRPLFNGVKHDAGKFAELTADLRHIAQLYGAITFSKDAAEAISDWHMAKGPPTPDHPRLLNYNTRRTAHLLKLCMVICAASSDQYVVTLEHYVEALDLLIEAEHFIPDIFKSMNSGGDNRVMEDTYYHVYQLYAREKKPIAESRVLAYLGERTPAHNVERVLQVMKLTKILEEKLDDRLQKAVIPMPRAPR